MSVTYEFETKEFSFREGYSTYQVRDGKLVFKTNPPPDVVAAIKRYGGKLAEDKPAAKQTRAETKTAAKAEAKTKDGE